MAKKKSSALPEDFFFNLDNLNLLNFNETYTYLSYLFYTYFNLTYELLKLAQYKCKNEVGFKLFISSKQHLVSTSCNYLSINGIF